MSDYNEHLISEAGGDEDEEVCGESFDHDEVILYDDDEQTQWECRRCGVEGWFDK